MTARTDWIEIGRYADREDAEEARSRIVDAGVPAEVVHAPNGSGPYALRVPAELEQEALLALDLDEEAPAPTPAPVARGRFEALIGLVAANVAVFLWMEWAGGSTDPEVLLRFGAVSTTALERGEWFRLLTAIFLHIGLVHLLSNMLTLGFLGGISLRTLGTGRVLILYVISGLAGNLLSWRVDASPGLRAGASGAILGLLGALVGASLRHVRIAAGGSRFKTWHVLLGGALLYAWIAGTGPADHVAHLGGALGGFALSLALPRPGELSSEGERRLSHALGALALLVLAAGGAWAFAALAGSK